MTWTTSDLNQYTEERSSRNYQKAKIKESRIPPSIILSPSLEKKNHLLGPSTYGTIPLIKTCPSSNSTNKDIHSMAMELKGSKALKYFKTWRNWWVKTSTSSICHDTLGLPKRLLPPTLVSLSPVTDRWSLPSKEKCFNHREREPTESITKMFSHFVTIRRFVQKVELIER